jgi:hypothetical protein
MQIVFNPKPKDAMSGTHSFSAWDSVWMKSAIEALFDVRADEVLERIEILPEGIRAKIERKEG